MKPNRHRLSARIDGDIAALLQQAARRRNVATSVIVNAALHAYLAPEAGDDRESVVTAHLERLSRQLQNTADKQDALQETMGLFVRIWFTYTPELPQAEKRAANQSAAACIGVAIAGSLAGSRFVEVVANPDGWILVSYTRFPLMRTY